ncbi:MAG: kelch repeat-containing protein [Myxococcaceae bacterium]
MCLTGGVGASGGSPGMPSMDWLDDLWEWDGNDWVDRTPPGWPPHRWYPALVYDEIRGQLVLVGGRVGNTYGAELFDTWEFDGTQWAQRMPTHQPGVTLGIGMFSFDVTRGKSVMVLPINYGVGGEVWEWDGIDWAQHIFFDGPGFTEPQGLQVYDPLVGQVALFRYDDAVASFSADWHWDGEVWSSSNVLPLERAYAALAYDPAAKRTVMFGGSHDGQTLDDTWAFDGATWTRLMVSGPPGRQNSTLVYDEARGQMVLFGGDDDGHLMGDTWVFDGAQWQQRQPQHAPPARLGHAMAYDRARQTVVLFGGAGIGQFNSYSGLSDTWEWDGTDWAQLSPMTSPPARVDSRMAYDAKRAQLVLFGGTAHPEYGLPTQNGWSLNDTWVFDTGEWIDVSGTQVVTERTLQAMAYDPVREVVMMFGGYSGAGSETRNDTWEWDGTQWTLRSPATPGPHLYGVQMVYDSARVDFVVMGGASGNGPDWGTNQTWLYIPPPGP